MARIPPRKQKGPHNPVDDQYLLELWKALKLENPNITKEEFGHIAQKNYYQKGSGPGPASISPRSIVRHLNRLLHK